jgi:hypothetical protein
LTSGVEETATQRIPLPEDDPNIVHLFVQWLYDPDPTFSVLLDEKFMQLARLFEFADRLFIFQLKNYVIWQFFNLRSKNHVPPIPVVEFVFENLPDDSPLRKLIVLLPAWGNGRDIQTLSKYIVGTAFTSAESTATKLRVSNRDVLAALEKMCNEQRARSGTETKPTMTEMIRDATMPQLFDTPTNLFSATAAAAAQFIRH